jgi:hypothetical protein
LKPILKPSRSGSKPGFETDVAARELATEAEEDSADCDGKGGGVDAKACDVWSLGVCLFYQGAFYTLVPIRPRRRGGRRSLRTFAVVSLRPPRAFNARPRRLSAPPDAFELHPDNRLYGTAPSLRRRAVPGRVRGGGGATRPRRLDAGACIASFNCVSSRSFVTRPSGSTLARVPFQLTDGRVNFFRNHGTTRRRFRRARSSRRRCSTSSRRSWIRTRRRARRFRRSWSTRGSRRTESSRCG